MFQKKQNDLDQVVINLQLQAQVSHQQIQEINTRNLNFNDLIGDLDKRIAEQVFKIDKKMQDFDPREFDLMSKTQFDDEVRAMKLNYDQTLKMLKVHFAELDERTDGID